MSLKRAVLATAGVTGSTIVGLALGFACQLVFNQQGWLLFGGVTGFVGGSFWLAMSDQRR